MKSDHIQTEIAELVGVHQSTISRELHRNRGQRDYRPKHAHRFCLNKRQGKALPRIELPTWKLVKHPFGEDWSRKRVLEWLQSGGTMHHHPRCQKQRKKRYGRYFHPSQMPNQVSIDECPAVVDSCSRFGGWKLDTVIGRSHQQALVTLVERKYRLKLIAKVLRKKADNVSDTIISLLLSIKTWVRTLTADNGRKFAQYERIATALHAKFYFSHPYAFWERGPNENTNSLIHQNFPKMHDFITIVSKQIEMVMDKLNNRPRKCLGFKTPNEVFFGIKPTAVLAT